MIFAVVFFAAYLLGSIPFGLVLTRLAGKGDLRRIGSGNIGATNVLRTGNKALALATLLLDGGKGALAVWLAFMYAPDFVLVAALGAFLGHIFPVWLRFKGGKGVATALGIYLALAWPIGIAACLLWLLTAAIFRYSSLAALIAVAVTPFLAWILDQPELTALFSVMAAIIIIRHNENIARLLKGTESKISFKRNAPA
jgi:glycerol-3-phosphate acyltransferase PlsY